MNVRTLRNLTYAWVVVILLAGWMAYDTVLGSVATTLSCDRPANTCSLSGGSQAKVPPPSQIKQAAVRGRIIHKEGEGYDLFLDDKSINPQVAFSEEAVADYRRAAEAINAFLKDPAKAHLAATFTYHASTYEKVRAVLMLVGTLAVMVLFIVLRRRAAADVTRA